MHILQLFPQIEYSSVLRRTCLFFSGFAIELFVKNELKRYTGENDPFLTPYKNVYQIGSGHCSQPLYSYEEKQSVVNSLMLPKLT